MISKRETQVFKDLLELKPAMQIEEYLKEHGITNRNGKPFSDAFITRVLNGKTAHRELERHIWDFIEIETLKRQERDKRREQLLTAAEELTND